MKRFAFILWVFIFSPLSAGADIIFFKDGMKTVCQDRAWEEDGEIKCEYNGVILSYQKKDVVRIEKTRIEKPVQSKTGGDQTPAETEAKQEKTPPDIKQSSPAEKKPFSENESEIASTKPDVSQTKGLEFYNPRRPQKYWTTEASKHHTFKEAVASLAKAYDRSPEWIQHHMGNTNDLYEIHQNLRNSRLNAPVDVQEEQEAKMPETLFYNPRRPRKYWTGVESKHSSFKEAIAALAKAYERTPEWVQKYMGTSNNLSEIHKNLTNQKDAETSP